MELAKHQYTILSKICQHIPAYRIPGFRRMYQDFSAVSQKVVYRAVKLFFDEDLNMFSWGNNAN